MRRSSPAEPSSAAVGDATGLCDRDLSMRTASSRSFAKARACARGMFTSESLSMRPGDDVPAPTPPTPAPAPSPAPDACAELIAGSASSLACTSLRVLMSGFFSTGTSFASESTSAASVDGLFIGKSLMPDDKLIDLGHELDGEPSIPRGLSLWVLSLRGLSLQGLSL